jgi:hypothetical protein
MENNIKEQEDLMILRVNGGISKDPPSKVLT